jgi:hypothetical protein
MSKVCDTDGGVKIKAVGLECLEVPTTGWDNFVCI